MKENLLMELHERKCGKLGRIRISRQFLQDSRDDVRSLLFSKFHPVAIRPDPHQGIYDVFEYFGLCEEFDETPNPATPIPEYYVKVINFPENPSIEFVKI